MTRWLPVFVALAAIVFCAVDYGYHYKRLPPRVASHFDAQGRADGWSTKGEMVGMALVTLVVVAATLAMMWLLAYYAPPSLINLPNKDYWLAPERQADTRQSLAQ